MTNKKKIDFIDEFLTNQENYCHGEEGENCTLSRKYLRDIEKQLTIPEYKILEWLNNKDCFNIPKDEVSKILEDWQTYNSNCI